MKRRRIALIGASMRVMTFVRALQDKYHDAYELVAIMDIDKGKMRGFAKLMNLDVPLYEDFAGMCSEQKPDMALITTVDCTHAGYVSKCLDGKIACIVEKPLCIDEIQCREILAAHARNPEILAVTAHNARYHITMRKLKALLDSGEIGAVRSVHYAEMLDLDHGASYFRRWNRRKKYSGGLQIHKSSHHFDKINWLLGNRAGSVTAFGALTAYGEKASPFHGERCSTCSHTRKCPFFLKRDAEEESIYRTVFYEERESDSFYAPELCVYSPEIDIEDFLSVGIMYENGVPVNYTLCAHTNYEGENIEFEGEKGRVEIKRRTYRENGKTVPLNKMELFRFGCSESEVFDCGNETGGHGGSDPLLHEDLFGNGQSAMLATLEDGIQAVLVGVAVNKSLEANGAKINVQDIL